MDAKAGGSGMLSGTRSNARGAAQTTAKSAPGGGRTSADPSRTFFIVADRLLEGLVPAAPFIGEKTKIVAFGSAFADHLAKSGRAVSPGWDEPVATSAMDDALVNSFTLRAQFEWAWLNRPRPAPWRGQDAALGQDEAARLRTAALFDAADVFILTLGSSEIWCDETTGEVFFEAPPADGYDAARHKRRVSTHHETLVNLLEIYKLVRQRRPKAAIVFALSPLPLAATFRPASLPVADAASKAILRAALDEFLRAAQPRDDRLFYFPGYEIAQGPLGRPFASGSRLARERVLDFAISLFERHYCLSGATDAQVERAFRAALAQDRPSRAQAQDAPADAAPEDAGRSRGEARRLERIAARKRDRAVKISPKRAPQAGESDA